MCSSVDVMYTIVLRSGNSDDWLAGIPISQQHLIWQSVELEDDFCLRDYSIGDGATLKLVLTMRGGPINTRRSKCLLPGIIFQS